MLLKILSLFFLVTISCALKNGRFRIYGGNVVPSVEKVSTTGTQVVQNNGEFPYVVAVEQLGQHICGGSLIKPEVVVTAAHCIHGVQPDAITVRAGGVTLVENSVNVQLRQVEYYVIHERYHKKLVHNDIALIRTQSPFHLNSIVNLIKLLHPNVRFYGRSAVIVGWGEDESTKLSNIIKKATISLINSKECAALFHPVPITTHMICGIDKAGKVRGICIGDSGGPMVIHDDSNPENDVLLGVSSWMSKPNEYCNTRYPSVFSDAVRLQPWILQKLNNTL